MSVGWDGDLLQEVCHSQALFKCICVFIFTLPKTFAVSEWRRGVLHLIY